MLSKPIICFYSKMFRCAASALSVVYALRERPLLQGVPSPKPIIGFGFTLCGALERYAGLCPAPHQRRCLWTPPKGHRPFGIPMLVPLIEHAL